MGNSVTFIQMNNIFVFFYLVFLGLFFFVMVRYWLRVGPLDNRPSMDKLHHFVQKKERKKEVAFDI